MELWIRSQNKTILQKVNTLQFIQSGSDLYDGVNYSIYGNDIKLGSYTSKERALEVLDEIQGIIIDYSKMSRVVYTMPNE